MIEATAETLHTAMRRIKNRPSEEFVPSSGDPESSICERFERIVRQYRERIAVKMGDRALTYDALNRAANRIAHAIVRARGTKSEPIALFFEHGIDSIIAILAVLKAGKFYLALDDSFPAERIQYILTDSQARLVLTHTRQLKFVRGLAGARGILNIDEVDAASSDDNLALPISPTDFASLIYTSGSTGTPKGVVGTHRIFLYGLGIFPEEHRVRASDRATLFHSVAYGSALTLLFHTLLNGGSLLPYDLKSQGVHRVGEWLAEEEVTVCHFPPAVFRQIAEVSSGQDKLTCLRLIHLSGAPITRQDFELYKKAFPEQTLLLMGMGSTETRWLTYAIVDHSFSFPDEGVPIGYPVPGANILLLDSAGREVQPGQAGEIAVKSRYLTEGYWQQPEMTAAKFRDDCDGGDERIYLTGDVGRRLPDGFFVHLGRNDDMVKIRGFRVEIGEIERALSSHPAVKESSVAAWDSQPNDKYLVGYVVLRQRAIVSAHQLKIFLRGRLPDCMVPSHFVFLEFLPLTNGKLDRQALPEPDRGRSNFDIPHVGATNELERQLVSLWEDALDVRPIGVNDNFFDLGGHSLAGARIISEVHRRYGMELPLQVLFESPTIAQLAITIKDGWKKKTRSADKEWRYLFELQAGRGGQPLFLFPGGGGSEPEFFIYAALARHLGSDYPVYGLRVSGADGLAAPHSSVKEMASAYLEELRAIQPTGPYYLIGECAGGVTAYEAARQLREFGEEVALLALLDVERPTLTNYWRYRAGEILCFSLIRFHWDNLRRLEWKHWPPYLRGEGTGGAPLPSACGQAADVLRARAQAVLEIDHLGKSAPHVETARANYRRVVRRYRPPCYAGPIAIIASQNVYEKDPTLGWSGIAKNNLRSHSVPGDHDSYLCEHVHVTAQQLRKCLERAKGRAADKKPALENVQAHA